MEMPRLNLTVEPLVLSRADHDATQKGERDDYQFSHHFDFFLLSSQTTDESDTSSNPFLYLKISQVG